VTAVEGFTLEPGPVPTSELVMNVWRHRTLLAVLARKDFHVRYRRASLGLLWAIGMPVLQAAVLAVVFGRFVADGIPHYAAFVLAGTVAWTFISSTIPAAATSIVDGSDLSTRIYFPRALFPLVSVAANVYGFVLALGVLLVGVIAFGVPLGARLLLLVPGALLAIAFTTACTSRGPTAKAVLSKAPLLTSPKSSAFRGPRSGGCRCRRLGDSTSLPLPSVFTCSSAAFSRPMSLS
jgi:hypothetical protein